MQEFLKKGMTGKFECRQKLYENNSLIDQYLKEKGAELYDEEREKIEGFKNRVSGDIISFKTLTHYTIFNSMKDNKIYAVKALGDSFTKFFRQFPVISKHHIAAV